jgi:mycothiol synthase
VGHTGMTVAHHLKDSVRAMMAVSARGMITREAGGLPRLKGCVHRLVKIVGCGGATRVAAGGPQLRMVHVFHNKGKLAAPKLPPGYRLLQSVPYDGDRWVELINESGEFGIWSRETLDREILSGLLPQGAILVACGDKLVACAAVRHLKQFEPYALLTYVIVLREHQGRGLGTLVSAEAMQAARRSGYPGVVLQTDDWRLPAIRTYLRLGFIPDLKARPCTGDRWKRVLFRTRINRKLHAFRAISSRLLMLR